MSVSKNSQVVEPKSVLCMLNMMRVCIGKEVEKNEDETILSMQNYCKNMLL